MVLTEFIKRTGIASNAIATLLLDAVLPKTCIQCEIEGEYMCRTCLDKVKIRFTIDDCSLCSSALKQNEAGEYGIVCKGCKQEFQIEGLITPYNYTDTLIEKSIHALKYRGVRELAAVHAECIYNYFQNIPYSIRPKSITDTSNIILIPMPLHKSKKLSRGFNQAELIADELSKKAGWKVDVSIVSKTKRTSSQIKLPKNERRYNMLNAFTVNSKLVKNSTYIIIDDVVTSGMSIGSLAKTLKENGARKIWAMTVAHG